MTVTAVLPFRSIDSAKSRMAPLLSEEERREFSARLLERTLLALGRATRIDSVILVSPDPLARALARSGGYEALDDGGVKLNAAITLGVHHAATSGASAVLVLPVDLAEISAANIDALLIGWSGSKPGLLASPDGGTSALLVPLPRTFTPLFAPNCGVKSCGRGTKSAEVPPSGDARRPGCDLDQPFTSASMFAAEISARSTGRTSTADAPPAVA